MSKIIIIGAGPGGYVAAIRAAQLGAKVTVVEKSEVGGVCLNRGCIPTKTLVASAKVLENVKRSGEYGVEISGDVSYNLSMIMERKNKVINTLVKGIRGLFKGWGIELIEGRGKLAAPNKVTVNMSDNSVRELKADSIIIATGSRPADMPPFPFDGKTILSSDDALNLNSIPKSILIIGAGVIGCEFAFILKELGSEVTIVEMLPRAVSTEDEEISEILERELKKWRIKLILGTKVERIEKKLDGITAILENGMEVIAEKILVSIGRTCNTENLGLEEIGVVVGKRGEIIVNEKMETSVKGVYAIGDVVGGIMLAHVASKEGLVAAANASVGNEIIDYSVIPAAIFTMPEIGSVGLREHQAKEMGYEVNIGRFQFRGLGKAHAIGKISGMVKIISEKNTDRILGVHIIGPHASDIIHEAAVAMRLGAKARDLAHTIHAHPTLSEALMEAAEDVHGMAIHGMPRK
ncbi:MAG: dihydrolipoyl dehydrogenase [Nitrospirota bacterium]